MEDMTELIELKEPLELMEWKEEINGSDGLIGIDGNYKANEIDRIETEGVGGWLSLQSR